MSDSAQVVPSEGLAVRPEGTLIVPPRTEQDEFIERMRAAIHGACAYNDIYRIKDSASGREVLFMAPWTLESIKREAGNK